MSRDSIDGRETQSASGLLEQIHNRFTQSCQIDIKDMQYNQIFWGAAMIYYISGDFFQHIKPLVESDTAHSTEHQPRANDHFRVSYVPPPKSRTPFSFSPRLLAPGTTFTSKTLLVVKSHPDQTRRFAPREGNNVNLFQLAGFNLVFGSQLCWEPLGGDRL